MKIEIIKYPRTCDNCGKGFSEGYYCCGNHACSEDCLRVISLDENETWEQHYEAMGGDEGGECYWSEWSLEDCEDSEDTQFQAILSKNLIAEELADFKKTGEINVDYILRQLRDIETFTGEMNQPSVMDTYENA